MKDHFDEAVRGVLRYTFEDGTTEIMIGMLFLWTGLVVKPLPVPEIPAAIIVIGVLLTFLLAAWMKRRYIYVRSGFINMRRPGRGQILATLAALLLPGLALVLPILLFWDRPELGMNWWTLLAGLLMAGGFLWVGVRLGYPRLMALAGCSAALGAWLSPIFIRSEVFFYSSQAIPYWVISPFQIFLPAYFLLMALGAVSTGGWSFLRYLRSHPRPAEASDGR